MNMLLLYPSETKVDTARNQDMLDFYMEKTGSVSAEHLQHKLQLYNDATDEKRRDDEYMCDLTKEFQSGAEPTAVVNEGRAGYTEYFERWVDNDEDDHRRTSNELWEENSRSAAEEQRLAAERNASAATRTNQDDGETTGAKPDGADTAVWLVATRPPSEPGHFWHDRAQRPTTFGWQRHENPAKVRRFLDEVSAITGTSDAWTGLRG
jgi:hypothetical protein